MSIDEKRLNKFNNLIDDILLEYNSTMYDLAIESVKDRLGKQDKAITKARIKILKLTKKYYKIIENMKEVIVIRPVKYDLGNMYVSSFSDGDVQVDQAENAKHFPSKQHAEDYLEKFPFLERDDDVLVNAYTIETLYIIEK